MKNLDEVENVRAFYDCIGTLKNCSATHHLSKTWILVKVIRNSSDQQLSENLNLKLSGDYVIVPEILMGWQKKVIRRGTLQ